MRTATLAPEKQPHHLPAVAHLSGGQGEDMSTRKPSYSEQLKNPKWQKKRLEVLDLAGWKCSCCETTEKTLHVHHKKYIKGRMAWEYDSEQLAVLCEDCHQEEHTFRELLDEIVGIGELTPGGTSTLAMCIGIVGGIAAAVGRIESDEVLERLFTQAAHEFFLGYVIASLGPTDLAKAAMAKHNPPPESLLHTAIQSVLDEEP